MKGADRTRLQNADLNAKGLGCGARCKYPDAFPGHWTEQQYLPDALKGRVYHKPGELGYEKGVKERLERMRRGTGPDR